MLTGLPSSSWPLNRLRREMLWWLVLGALLILAVHLTLRLSWGALYATRWLLLPALAVLYQTAVLAANLKANHRRGETHLLPGLGWGNRLTLLRGLLTAGLLGFLLLPRPHGWLAWLPGLLYTLACAADFFDGYVARRTGYDTRLGEVLDMSLDGLGVLAASWLAVKYGQVPAWYLLVGVARYLFLGGSALRRWLGKPLFDLPPDPTRRVFAGLQMGFLAVVLWPLFSPPGTHIAALLFGAPLLIGFGRDWLYVSGARGTRQSPASSWSAKIAPWGLFGVRLLIVGLNLEGVLARASLWQAQSWPGLALEALNAVVVVMLAVGILPRVAAGFGLGFLGFYQMLSPLTLTQIALAFAYTLILYVGGGALTRWAAEETLFRRYAGQRPTQQVGEQRS